MSHNNLIGLRVKNPNLNIEGEIIDVAVKWVKDPDDYIADRYEWWFLVIDQLDNFIEADHTAWQIIPAEGK